MPELDLLRFNPWWEDKEAIGRDPDIVRFEQQKIKYFPEFPMGQGIYVIRGPRQVGKTTLVKLKIKELLNGGSNPKAIFFYSFELRRKTEEVYATVLEYLDKIAPSGKRYLFLDETTTIPEWARPIKLLADRGDLRKEDTVLVTGSSSIDLQKGAERLPGRGIEGNEYFYLPASFRRYLYLKGMEFEAADPFRPDRFYEIAKSHWPKMLTLQKEFLSYLNSGGFLYSINHGWDDLVLEKYARWLEGDFVKWGKDPFVVKEIVQAVVKKGCSQFSYHSIVKETSVSSHNTIIEYLDMLDEELFLRIVNKALLPFGVERRKEKKAFFLDPLLMIIAERWADQRIVEACKVEQVVAGHLARMNDIYFYNDGKKEIDCLLKSDKKVLGVEVKWSGTIASSDTQGVRKTGIAYLLSKETLDKINDIPVIPVPIFLALLPAGEIIRRNLFSLR